MAGAGRGSVNPPAASSTPDMSAYVPRRTPGPLADVDRPGNRARYENEEKELDKLKAAAGLEINTKAPVNDYTESLRIAAGIK
jgi:hypothetical protein